MKKFLKLLFIILIIILTLQVATNVTFAKIDVENFQATHNINLENEKQTAGRIIGVMRNIAVVATVVIIAYLGLKFMLGSVEQRAEYKKSFIPLLIGVFIIGAATTIMSIVWDVGTEHCDHNWRNIGNNYSYHQCSKCGATAPHQMAIVNVGGQMREKCEICGALGAFGDGP